MKKTIERLIKYLKWTKSTQITYAKIKKRVHCGSDKILQTALDIFVKNQLVKQISGQGKRAVYRPNVVSDFVIIDGVMVKYIGKNPKVRIPADVRCIAKSKVSMEEARELVWIVEPWIFIKNAPCIEIALPNTVEKIDSCAFSGLNLQELIMPDSVKETGHATLSNCKKIKRVSVSKLLKIIEKHTFCNCFELKEVVLPKGLEHIMPYAFCGCKNLETIIFGGNEEEWSRVRVDEYNEELKRAKILFCGEKSNENN